MFDRLMVLLILCAAVGSCAYAREAAQCGKPPGLSQTWSERAEELGKR